MERNTVDQTFFANYKPKPKHKTKAKIDKKIVAHHLGNESRQTKHWIPEEKSEFVYYCPAYGKR